MEFRVTQVRGHRVFVAGVNSAREQDSSVGGVPVVKCLGVDHMEDRFRSVSRWKWKEKSKG